MTSRQWTTWMDPTFSLSLPCFLCFEGVRFLRYQVFFHVFLCTDKCWNDLHLRHFVTHNIPSLPSAHLSWFLQCAKKGVMLTSLPLTNITWKRESCFCSEPKMMVFYRFLHNGTAKSSNQSYPVREELDHSINILLNATSFYISSCEQKKLSKSKHIFRLYLETHFLAISNFIQDPV